MKRLIAALAATLSLASWAWGGEPTLYVALLDCSKSVSVGSTTSPFAANVRSLEKVILALPKGSTMLVYGFGKRMEPLLKVTTPERVGPQGRYLRATAESAVRKLRENLAARVKETDPSGTDVDGAIYRASRVFSEESAGRSKVLYLFSDLQDTQRHRLILKKLAKAQRGAEALDHGKPPDLRGTKVHILSSFADRKGVPVADAERAIQALKDCWEGYFREAGAVVVEYRTVY